MTIAERLEMYQEKRNFVKSVSKTFEKRFKSVAVTSVDYEVYKRQSPVDPSVEYFVEYIIVNFIGGAKCVKTVTGNSHTANFRTIGSLVDGGYYDEVEDYKDLSEMGYEPVKLYDNVLDELLVKPFEHISDIRRCFNYCKDGNDVEKVIGRIPTCFGTFDVEYGEDNETFTIINYYEEHGVDECEEAEYEFYPEEY